MKKTVFVSLLMAFALFACAPMTKTQYIERYDDFMEEVESDHESYSKRDWERKNQELSDYLTDQYPEFKQDMTDEEKARVWAQALSYYVHQHGDRAIEHLAANREVYLRMMQEHSDLILELTDQFSEDVIPELQRLMPEIKALTEDLIESLKRKGTFDKMEQIFEEFGENMEELGEELGEEMEELGEELEKEMKEVEKELERAAEEAEKEMKKNPPRGREI